MDESRQWVYENVAAGSDTNTNRNIAMGIHMEHNLTEADLVKALYICFLVSGQFITALVTVASRRKYSNKLCSVWVVSGIEIGILSSVVVRPEYYIWHSSHHDLT